MRFWCWLINAFILEYFTSRMKDQRQMDHVSLIVFQLLWYSFSQFMSIEPYIFYLIFISRVSSSPINRTLLCSVSFSFLLLKVSICFIQTWILLLASLQFLLWIHCLLLNLKESCLWILQTKRKTKHGNDGDNLNSWFDVVVDVDD